MLTFVCWFIFIQSNTSIMNNACAVYCTFFCVPQAALSYIQLLVGSEDFDIRVFREEELVSEMAENEVTLRK